MVRTARVALSRGICTNFTYMEPVGTMEIAERLGVTRHAVDKWRQRDPTFPEPRWKIGGRPAWNWADVEAWHTAWKAK